MYDERFFSDTANYMSNVRKDIWPTENDARIVLDNLCWEAQNNSNKESFTGGYASTGGFTVTYDLDQEAGFGEFSILENIVSVWNAGEYEENRGFYWKDSVSREPADT